MSVLAQVVTPYADGLGWRWTVSRDGVPVLSGDAPEARLAEDMAEVAEDMIDLLDRVWGTAESRGVVLPADTDYSAWTSHRQTAEIAELRAEVARLQDILDAARRALQCA